MRKWIKNITLATLAVSAVACLGGASVVERKVSAETPDGFTMTKGASIRYDETINGLRFRAQLPDDYDTTKTYKMMIIPYDYIDTYNLTGNYYDALVAAGVKNIVTMECNPFQATAEDADCTEGKTYIQGSITSIRYHNITRDFFGIAYYEDGDTEVYATFNEGENVRSVFTVASMALNSGKYEANDAILNSFITQGINYEKGTSEENKNDAVNTDYTLDVTDFSLKVGASKTLTLKDAIGEIAVEWSASDNKVVTVKDGVVTAVGAGETTVKAKYLGKTVTANVNVAALGTETFDGTFISSTPYTDTVSGPVYEGSLFNISTRLSSAAAAAMQVEEGKLIIKTLSRNSQNPRYNFKYTGEIQANTVYTITVPITPTAATEDDATTKILFYGIYDGSGNVYKTLDTTGYTGEKTVKDLKLNEKKVITVSVDTAAYKDWKGEFIIGVSGSTQPVGVLTLEIDDVTIQAKTTQTETFTNLDITNKPTSGGGEPGTFTGDILTGTVNRADGFIRDTSGSGVPVGGDACTLKWTTNRICKEGTTNYGALTFTFNNVDRNAAYDITLPITVQHALNCDADTMKNLTFKIYNVAEDKVAEKGVQLNDVTKITTESSSSVIQIKTTLSVRIPANSDWSGSICIMVYEDSREASNGVKLNILFDNVSIATAEEVEASLFGLCAVIPPSSSVDEGVTAEIASTLVGAMGAESARVWMHVPYVLDIDGAGNLNFDQGKVDYFHAYYASLKKAGVKQIVAMSHQYLYPVGYTPSHYTVVPTPGTPEYQNFLNLFGACYKKLATEFPEVSLWEPNNEVDHPNGNTIMKPGYTAGADKTEYQYTRREIARITADMCYYARQGVKAASAKNEIVFPGMVYGFQDAANGRENFLKCVYEEIESGGLPTGKPAVTDPDAYFDYLNWHPYTQQQPSQDADWLSESIENYQVAAAHGDGDKPILLTEYGWADGYDETRQEKIAAWYIEGIELLKANLPTLKTIFCFRMFNYSTAPDTVKDMEKTFGLFTSSADAVKFAPKPAAIALFKYFNGENANTAGLYQYQK